MLTILPAKATLAILLPLYLMADFWTVWIWRGYAVKKLFVLDGGDGDYRPVSGLSFH